MKKTKNIKQAEQVDFIFIYDEDKEVKLTINNPNFDIVAESYKYLYDENNSVDLIKPGKIIFDLCTIEYDEVLDINHQLMLSVAAQLTKKFCLPINLEIKKN